MMRALDSRVRMAMRGTRANLERLMTEEDLDALYGFIEAEIIAAVEDMREACALVANETGVRIPLDDYDALNRKATALTIAERIRALPAPS